MRTRQFTVALLIALAITALWWQLAEKRARKAEGQLHLARQTESGAERHARALDDSIRALDQELRRCREESRLGNR